MIARAHLRHGSLLLFGCFALALAGCPSTGGGGGGGTANENDNTNGNQNLNGNDNTAGQNQAPTADAGADQSVGAGDLVELDGSGSDDPDGDALGYAWTQTAGTPVTLSGANTATPTFTAPGVSGTLTFQLNVHDGNGGTDNDTVNVVVVAEPSVLFVVNNNDSITSYLDPRSLDGDVAPATDLPVGGATRIFQPRSIVVTDDGVLLISSQIDAIVGYEDAFTATGNQVVDRTIEGNATLLSVPISFAYDGANDLLYVGNTNAADGILVFENVSATDFDGDVAPARSFGPTDRSPFGQGVSITSTFDAMWLDADGNLFASDTSGLNVNQSRILVFADPETADGATEPAQEFTSTSWGQIEDIFVDDNDVLYVVDGEDYVVIVNDATALMGEVSASATFTVQADLPQLEGIVVGRDGIGYVADRGNFAIYSFDDIADLSGFIAPDRAIEGNATQLRSPRQMFLFEPGS